MSTGQEANSGRLQWQVGALPEPPALQQSQLWAEHWGGVACHHPQAATERCSQEATGRREADRRGTSQEMSWKMQLCWYFVFTLFWIQHLVCGSTKNTHIEISIYGMVWEDFKSNLNGNDERKWFKLRNSWENDMECRSSSSTRTVAVTELMGNPHHVLYGQTQ